jgi:precorrin isomerase
LTKASDNIKQKDIESKEIVFVIGESKTALALLNY